jgi:hypothetical protein
MTLIAPASIITAVCSSCRSMAGNDGARQNRTAKVPSQHDCTVIELRAESGPAPVLASSCRCNIFGPMLRQRCQPIPHRYRDRRQGNLIGLSWFGGVSRSHERMLEAETGVKPAR